jgi:anti-sigma28 factor (negative regulator of flagellin synthesis)
MIPMYWFTSTCLEVPRSASRACHLSGAEPFRTELIERVRAEIAAGAYETDEKWEIALDRLLDRLEQA